MTTISPNKRLVLIILSVAVLLLIPLAGMLFSNEVKWTLFDFTVAAGLLLGTGLLCELVLRKVKSSRNRIVICALILLILLLTWIELAVGIFGTPLAGS